MFQAGLLGERRRISSFSSPQKYFSEKNIFAGPRTTVIVKLASLKEIYKLGTPLFTLICRKPA
jgi:hypothetical protein